ncbi:MAG: hypothetical protein KIT84_40750 [Labilithrix sp.]|nr:hypothetical protein [Labilithrix sp.]MCW5817399.1 hypothetical protein [Labilithrix sp.]
MSSTSRSPDDNAPPPVEESGSRAAVEPSTSGEKKAGRPSPGRYSLSDSDEDTAQTRIDSTMRMPAVKPEPPSSSPRSSRTGLAAQVGPPTPQPSPKPGTAPAVATKPDPPRATLTSPTGGTFGRPLGASAVTGPNLGAHVPPRPNLPRPGTPAAAFPARPAPRFPTQRAMPAPQASGAAPVDTVDRIPDSIVPKFDEPAPASARAGLPRPSRASQQLAAIALGEHISTAPPSPRPPPAQAQGVLDDFDDGSIASAFDALVSEDVQSQPGRLVLDLQPVRELFSELAANHMRHVRDFMIDVKWGEVTRDWIHICLPPVRTLRRAAERLELAELEVALGKLAIELDRSNEAGGQMLDSVEKQRLLETYNALVDILPQAFALDRDKTQREAVIVQALLLQIPDVRKVTIDKLHAAGLTSLTVLFEANANDISHVAGIPLEVATRIVERVDAYRNELKASSPTDARAAERERLAALAKELKTHHDGYEDAANGWGSDAKAKKREHFKGREEAWLEISVLLARFGEVDRLQGIEKVPFAQRITQLSDYLEEAADKYRSPEG